MNLSPLPLAVFVVDAAGAVTSWNKACEKLAGYGPADIQGMTLEHIVEFDDPPGTTPRMAARADAENDAVLKCADGRRLPVRVMVALQCVELVLLQAARRLGLEDHHAFLADAGVAQRQQAFLDRRRQRRRRHVEARVHRARHLVHVLPARALRPDRAEFHFRRIDDCHCLSHVPRPPLAR